MFARTCVPAITEDRNDVAVSGYGIKERIDHLAPPDTPPFNQRYFSS